MVLRNQRLDYFTLLLGKLEVGYHAPSALLPLEQRPLRDVSLGRVLALDVLVEVAG